MHQFQVVSDIAQAGRIASPALDFGEQAAHRQQATLGSCHSGITLVLHGPLELERLALGETSNVEGWGPSGAAAREACTSFDYATMLTETSLEIVCDPNVRFGTGTRRPDTIQQIVSGYHL